MHDDLFEEPEATDESVSYLPELDIYKKFISTLPAYSWLVESVRAAVYLGAPGDTQLSIRDAFLNSVPNYRIVSRKDKPPKHSIIFVMDWNPSAFFQEQQYEMALESAMERALTITGSEEYAQAATTAQYLSQTWPTSGIHLLHIVKRAVQNAPKIPFCCTYRDPQPYLVCSNSCYRQSSRWDAFSCMA